MDLAGGLRRGNEQASRSCASVQAPVPDRDDELGVGDSQGAGEVDGVRAPQRVPARKQPGVPLHGRSELDRAAGRPVLLEGPLSRGEVSVIEIVVAGGRGERGTHLGIGQPARERGVTSVPQLRGQIAAFLLGQQLHQGAGIEVDQRHPSAPLFADDVGHRPARTGTGTPRRGLPLARARLADHAFGSQALEYGGRAQTQQPRDRDAAIGDYHLVALACSLQPIAKVCPEFSNGDIHNQIVHSNCHSSVQDRRLRLRFRLPSARFAAAGKASAQPAVRCRPGSAPAENPGVAQAPAIIFVDEVDAIGQRRAGTGAVSIDEREQTLNQLLAEMDGCDMAPGVLVLAATNRPEVLDPALLRPGRFDRQVTIPLPTLTERAAILAVHCRGKRLDPAVDLTVVARGTPGFAGADLANLANEAAIVAVRENHEVLTAADFAAARDRIPRPA